MNASLPHPPPVRAPRNAVVRRALAVLVLLSAAASTHAATVSPTFRNEFTTNAIYLWAAAAGTVFSGVSFTNGPVSDWARPLLEPDAVVMSGPAIAANSGRFRITFDYTPPALAFEWAEVLWVGEEPILQAAGTLSRSGGAWLNSPQFTRAGELLHPAALSGPATVPLPPSALLLAAALAALLPRACRRPGEPATRHTRLPGAVP